MGALVLAGGCSGQFTSWYTDSNGVVHAHCWGGCTPATETADGSSVPDSAAVKDALAIQGAENSSARAIRASHGVVALINRAALKREAAAATLIRLKLPPLAATIASELPSVRDSVLAADLQTTAGQTCRVAVLRVVAKTQWVYGSIAREAAAGRSPAKVVSDLVHGLNTVHRAFEADLKPCLAGLQPDERPAVKYILGA
jgi:hypothetical protein